MHDFKSKFEIFQQHALYKSAQSSQIATTDTLLISTLLISTISANNRHFVNQHNLHQQHAFC
ncbi:hypothetical protein Hanom_Chr06g00504461 [Helianthus anomalus]